MPGESRTVHGIHPVLEALRAHPDDVERIYVLEGSIKVHTEFYDPVVLKSGESIYVDSNMGHAYVAEGCDEATVLGICSSADESLMESLMSLHGEASAKTAAPPAKKGVRPSKPRKR